MHRPGMPALFPILLALLAGCADSPVAPVGPAQVASVEVSPAGLALRVGASAAVAVTLRDVHGAVMHGFPVAWTSTDTTVATVSPEGMVSARGAGTATIRASSEGKSGGVAVTVDELTVAWILITPAGGTIPQAIGSSRQLGVVARALDGTEIVGRPVSWSSSEPLVASVGETGLLQAHAAGTTTITAMVDGKRDSTIVSVPSLIARIESDPAELALGVGDASTITATALDANGIPLERTFAWSSSNAAVATVDAWGKVVATGAGTALITATSEGKRATTLVTTTGTQWRLADAAGAPLPAILYAITTTANGLARESRFQVTGGTLRVRDGRYELRLDGWLLADGAAPVQATVGSEGIVAYDVFNGAPLYFEGDDWMNREPRFRGRFREEGGVELDWSREPGAPVVSLGFAR